MIRKACAYILFWIGDGVSKVMNWADWGWLYPVYNTLMCWSSDIQGEGDNGPWRNIDDVRR